MILDRILATKAEEVAAARAQQPLAAMQAAARAAAPARDFAGALRRPQPGAPVACVAEVKKASPSKGVIRPDFDPVQIARRYAAAGAAAISVLTDVQYFQGALAYLEAIHAAVPVPLLRKDFIIDAYQIYEARAAGADAILLIVAAIPDAPRLREYRLLAAELSMASLVEVHTAAELDIAVASGAGIIGINNRDLHTFHTSLDVTVTLAPQVPPEAILVAESGISSLADCRLLAGAGAHAVLVGESLMRRPDPGEALRQLLGL